MIASQTGGKPMRRSTLAITASALALLAGASQAAAQQATPLALGQEVSGSLTPDDAQVDDADMGQYIYDLYEIQARDGQRLEFTMRSEAFDSYLELLAQGSEEVLASDDDGLGEGLHSRLRFNIDGDATYVLRARNLGGLEGGDYQLKVVDRGPAPPAPRPTAIRLGTPIQGEITDADPEEEKKPENIDRRLRQMFGPEARWEHEWTSVYTFTCRMMERFVHGRVIFAGDAAHVVSPFGARGAVLADAADFVAARRS
ncbi:MAG: hypothetical protein B7Z42_09475 [Brevundimonas sp. 12-68-7]|nr:MAG: hypothetical protein B7Z42_09475 [Brevundimonas sp. 12-68-7]